MEETRVQRAETGYTRLPLTGTVHLLGKKVGDKGGGQRERQGETPKAFSWNQPCFCDFIFLGIIFHSLCLFVHFPVCISEISFFLLRFTRHPYHPSSFLFALVRDARSISLAVFKE